MFIDSTVFPRCLIPANPVKGVHELSFATKPAKEHGYDVPFFLSRIMFNITDFCLKN
jgi:hypothetical protein